MVQRTVIDTIYDEHLQIFKYLEDNGEISFANIIKDNFRRTLLLASASYFESKLTEDLESFFREHTKTADIVLQFIKNKAMTRQYHTYFVWDGKNANNFFSLFGPDFKQFAEKQVSGDEVLKQGIEAFLEIGNYRNMLVHQNFANFSVAKTIEEIYVLYGRAMYFVEKLDIIINEFILKPL